MSNQPPTPPTPPNPPGNGDDGPSWPTQPPSGGGQPPSPPPPSPGEPAPQPTPPAGDDAGQPPDHLPPPPPPPGGGPGGSVSGEYSPTEAIAYGWRKFLANVGPIVGFVVIGFLVLVVVTATLSLLTGGLDRALSLEAPTVADRMVDLASQFLGLLVSAAIVRGTLAIVDGRDLKLAEFFRLEQMGQVVIAALLLSMAGLIVLFIPVLGFLLNIAISFLGQFALFFILDQDQPAIDAITSSVSFTSQNVGPLLVFLVLGVLVVFAGALACGIGLVAALPVVSIAQAYTFRRLRGAYVAA